MTSIEQGFVPVHLCEWRETPGEGDLAPIAIDALVAELFPENARAGSSRILVRGLPGGGKTTLLRFLGHHFATLGLTGAKEVIPVYARLRDFRCGKATLEDFVCQQIDADSDSPEMCEVLCHPGRRLDRSNRVAPGRCGRNQGPGDRREDCRIAG